MNEIAEAVARLFEADPHQWSKRPCQTCLAVSSLLTRPFGCIKKAAVAKDIAENHFDGAPDAGKEMKIVGRIIEEIKERMEG
jgi:hypothetical protein